MISTGRIFHCRRQSWPVYDYVQKPTRQQLEEDPGAPPPLAWRRKLNCNANLLKEFSVTFYEAMKLLGLGMRLWTYVKAERAQGRKAPIDPFNRDVIPSSCHGVPLGGMGGGSIGRGFRGEFRRWQLLPGVCEEAPVLANQFSVFVSRKNGKGQSKKFSSVLAPVRPEEIGGKGENAGISSWNWNLNGKNSTYHALFPRAWTIYDGEPDPHLKISCRQISPFIPHNYKESSLPACVFSYVLINTGQDDAKVTLLFTWANSIGGSSHYSGGHFNKPFEEKDGVCGMLLHHKTASSNSPITYAIAARRTSDVAVSVCPSFDISGREAGFTAKDMWIQIAEEGFFPEKNWVRKASTPSLEGTSVGAAVAACVTVPANGQRTVVFGLGWDSPEVRFIKGRSYNRRYTQFYGAFGDTATKLAHDAIVDYRKWEAAIEDWQSPILKDDNLPEWYRYTLFNELYYLVAGGTVWTDGGPPMKEAEPCIGSPDSTVSVYTSGLASPTNSDTSTIEATEPDAEKLKTFETLDDVTFWDTKSSLAEDPLSCSGIGESDKLYSDMRKKVTRDSELPERCDEVGLFDTRGKVEVPEQLLKVMLTTSLEKKNGPSTWNLSSGISLLQENEENVGQFLYLEGLEYVMWCTYDVHFYASFALLSLFPKLELSIQRDFAAATLVHNPERVKFLAEGNSGIRKVVGAVPHDLGTHDPWVEVNAYNIHDTSRWKDLNPKFVLQTYRDVFVTGDMAFAKAVWPAVYSAMAYMDQFDRDRDGLIENDGFPDQTYDTWPVHGVSAYCGGLWLAALQAAAAMAERLDEKEAAQYFRAKFSHGRSVYEKLLWNGSYFKYDSGSSSNSNSIQADQMAGQWYAWASGLPPLFDDHKARSALRKVYEFNVLKINGGRNGAVNGMHPDGKVDETCMQSREIWTGVTYAVAASMIHEGMLEEAFRTAEGVFQAGWSESGHGCRYWFQTPEGWSTDGHYRSLAYMRPLAIWAMQWALYPPKCMIGAPQVPTMHRGFSLQHHSVFLRVAEAFKHDPRPKMEKVVSILSGIYNLLCRTPQ
ncbi:hypothetical protein O6H91_02G149200 [Diphasiastrum complanatum]|uniref:Uncharacterized protein n=1 Tax=Diphasiastrum complanatum TaxID=34168 RepID=A0ACC2ELN8_DIPCM|nr:hypothetical protein O6H91_02G149200 [Diphasiastrum complanatum]